MSTFHRAQSHDPGGKSTFLRAHSSEPGGKLTFLRGHQRWDRVPLGNSEFKCQHSQFTYSLLIKRNLPIFERVPLSWPRFEPRTSCFVAEHLTTWSTQASLKMGHSLGQHIVDAAIAKRSLRCIPRIYFKQVNFFEFLNYGKIAGLRPAIFSGTPSNFEA